MRSTLVKVILTLFLPHNGFIYTVSVRLAPSTTPTEPDDITDQYTLNHLTAGQQLDEEALTLPEELLFGSAALQNALVVENRFVESLFN